MSNEKGSLLKYALIPTAIVLFLAIYPQLNIWLVKGSAWNGAFVVSNYDEVAYSGYVNALIEGRPRKSDPFIGQDNIAGETLYSIQAVPRTRSRSRLWAFGLSAASAFVILNFLIAIFSSFAVFGLLRAVTSDDLLAGVGVVAVLCLGTAAAFQGELQHMILGNYICDFFPFLRRYQPGLAFPLFFVFCTSAWRLFDETDSKRSILYAILTGIVLALLVFLLLSVDSRGRLVWVHFVLLDSCREGHAGKNRVECRRSCRNRPGSDNSIFPSARGPSAKYG